MWGGKLPGLPQDNYYILLLYYSKSIIILLIIINAAYVSVYDFNLQRL